LVADLVRSKVDVIVQDSTVGTQITKRATSNIPIVMALVLDPVGSGLVESLARPGGNVTGLSMMAMELYAKRLQLLKISSRNSPPPQYCGTRTIHSTPEWRSTSKQLRPRLGSN
jgi:ABC-type uncharacterized transport system substrate-binding protein